MTKLAASQHQEIANMYVAGSTQMSVSRAFGISGSRVCQILRNYGVGRKDRIDSAVLSDRNYDYVVDPSRHASMADMYRRGSTLQQVGVEYGISRERVRQILARMGISRLDGGKCITSFVKTYDRSVALRDKAASKECKVSALWGMSMADYKAHVAEFGSSTSKVSPMSKYNQQRKNAKQRGIAWEFDFASWWRVWQESGKWDLRGRGNGYVMARWGDGDAPYSVETVYICTQSQNSKDSYIITTAQERAAKRVKSGHSKAGLGLGYTKSKRLKARPYQAQFCGKYLGAYATAEQARAAYLAAVAAAKN